MGGKSKFWSMTGTHKSTGLRFESGLEKRFLDQSYMLGIKVRRCTDTVPYKGSDEKWHTYLPDFELSDFRWIIEVKGKWAVCRNHAHVREKFQAAMTKYNGRYSIMTEVELKNGYLARLYARLVHDGI